MNITDFLEARIAEDDRECRHMLELVSDAKDWDHAYAERVLAECAAKRAIITSLNSTAAAHAAESHLGQKFVLAGMDTGLRLALQMLTLPYREHPDFKEEWAHG